MKNRFKEFIFTYFYFTPQEKKGVLSLFILVLLVQAISWTYPYLQKHDAPAFQAVLFDSLDLSETATKRTTYLPKTRIDSFKVNAYPHQNYSVRTEKNDSQYLHRKVKYKWPIDLNQCDSEALVSLPKIGQVMAHKIIAYRNQLGGFNNLQQLTEIYGFQEDWLFDLKDKITLQSKDRQVFDINKVSFEQLKTHPYFKITLSRAIVQYRNQHGPYVSVQDLRKIKLVNDSIFNLILPYCEVR